MSQSPKRDAVGKGAAGDIRVLFPYSFESTHTNVERLARDDLWCLWGHVKLSFVA